MMEPPSSRQRINNIVIISHMPTPQATSPPHHHPQNPEYVQVQIPVMEEERSFLYEEEGARRQRQRMVSMFFFLLFIMMFYDNKRHNASDYMDMDDMNGMNAMNDVSDVERFHRNQRLINESIEYTKQLNEKKEASFLYYFNQIKENHTLETPYEVSGIYSGNWKTSSVAEHRAETDWELIFPLYSEAYYPTDHIVRPLSNTTGEIYLFLHSEPCYELQANNYMEYVTGQVIISDEPSTFSVRWISVQGVYLKPTGKLYLYGNRPDGSLKMIFPNMTQQEHLLNLQKVGLNQTNGNENSTNVNVSSIVLDPTELARDLLSYQISPIVKKGTPYDRQYLRANAASGNVNIDNCHHQFNLQLVPNSSLSSNTSFIVAGSVTSTVCNTSLDFSATFLHKDMSVFSTKAMGYALIILSICCFQVYLLLRQLSFSNTPLQITRMSLVTIGQQAILDSYLCLVHLTIGIVAQSLFALFAAISFMQLIIFSIFEMRHLLLVWKARYTANHNEGWANMRRELNVLYSRFYFALLAGIILVYNLWSYLDFFVLVAHSFWIPQIVHNVHRNIRNPLDIYYLFGISALRLFIPLYFYSYTFSFLSSFPLYHGSPNLSMCFLLIIWMGLQVAILFLQRKLGARFFIPARFLPKKYDYHRPAEKKEAIQMTLDCVICMGDIELKLKDYMVTPCNHFFHMQCLSDWMHVKLECPTCRAVLPSNEVEE